MPDKKLTYRERNGTTRVGDFLRGVKNVAPEILDLAGKVTGVGGLSVLADKIKGTDSMSDLDKELALKEIELDIADTQETSKRWQFDMMSDSWLSKNVRPLILMYLTACMTLFIILDSSIDGFTVQEAWISLLSTLLLLVYGAYFGARTLEKIKQNNKNEDGKN